MIKVVTSFSAEGYQLYGKKMMETFVAHWPGELHVYLEGTEGTHPDIPQGKIIYHNLFDVPGCLDFLQAASFFPLLRGEIQKGKYNYRYDIFRFARKMFAQLDAAIDHDDLLFWLDADTITLVDIEEEWLRSLFNGAFMIFMGRPEWHSCASFVGWDCTHPQSNGWWINEYDLLITGKFMTLPEYHDSYLLDVLREASHVEAVDLTATVTEGGPVNVFDIFFDGKAKHFKGNKKFGPKRYGQLIDIVAKKQPKCVLEIGTWNGERALEMAAASPGMRYIGLDLFEEATPQTDKEEKNVKPHFSVEDIYHKLKAKISNVLLMPGNTRETMPILAENLEEKPDLIYIDGGHSVETIESDFLHSIGMITDDGVIVLDDYYVGMPDEHIDQFGCNRVLEASGYKYEVLPIVDPVVGGGGTQMVVIYMSEQDADYLKSVSYSE